MIKDVTIFGYRGFEFPRKISFAFPNNSPGSGLTYIVGPNNCGKSTILEAIKLFTKSSAPGISIGRRNVRTDRIKIDTCLTDGTVVTLRTIDGGGSETLFDGPIDRLNGKIYFLPSRRKFQTFFSRSESDRNTYIRNTDNEASREYTSANFHQRLFDINRNRRRAFTDRLISLTGDTNIQDWNIELDNHSQHFVNIKSNDSWHHSEGAGEGILSLLFIVDALENWDGVGIVLIDEPELSLSPIILRNLSNYLTEKATNAQIVIATHSPYLLDWAAIKNGGKIYRVIKDADNITVHSPAQDALNDVVRALTNNFNPHVLGLEAREILFVQDNIVLTEGQEDVVFLKLALKAIGLDAKANFFGYGVGGKSSMKSFVRLFVELGYKKIRCILDSDAQTEASDIKSNYPNVTVRVSPLGDVRDKDAVAARPARPGLMKKNGEINSGYEDVIREFFNEDEIGLAATNSTPDGSGSASGQEG
jgi:predicted ATP-dependent endonuclease of OLD family